MPVVAVEHEVRGGPLDDELVEAGAARLVDDETFETCRTLAGEQPGLVCEALELVRGKFSRSSDPGEVTHFQALSSAVSGTWPCCASHCM